MTRKTVKNKNKKVEISSNVSVIVININGLKPPTKSRGYKNEFKKIW